MRICPICGKPQVEVNRKHPLAKGLVYIKVLDEPRKRYCICDPADIEEEIRRRR